MDLREVGWEVVDGIHLVQVRGKWRIIMKTVMKLQIP